MGCGRAMTIQVVSWGQGSVTEWLPSVHEALGLVPSTGAGGEAAVDLRGRARARS